MKSISELIIDPSNVISNKELLSLKGGGESEYGCWCVAFLESNECVYTGSSGTGDCNGLDLPEGMWAVWVPFSCDEINGYS